VHFIALSDNTQTSTHKVNTSC